MDLYLQEANLCFNFTRQTEISLREYIDYLFDKYISSEDHWKRHLPPDMFKQVESIIKHNSKVNIDVNDLDLRTFLDNTLLWDLNKILEYNYILFKDEISITRTALFNIIKDINAEPRRATAHNRTIITFKDVNEAIELGLRLYEVNPILFREYKAFLYNIDENKIIDGLLYEINKNNNIPMINSQTPFRGRQKEEINLVFQLNSYLPSINITGLGGVGKTVLVQHTLFRCIKENLTNFDFYIWWSAKENYLNELGIQPTYSTNVNLDDIISTILLVAICNKDINILKSKYIGLNEEDKYKVIEELLKSKRIILVIDNAETIRENTKIMGFLYKIISKCQGSKILFTSRTGVDIGGIPIIISGLDELAALAVFDDTYSKIFNDKDLYKNDTKRAFVKLIDYSPLAIKWCIACNKISPSLTMEESFVAAIQKDSDYVKFCFEKLIDELLVNNINLLHILYALSIIDSLTKNSISFLLGIDNNEIQDLIYKLFSYNMIQKDESESEVKYYIPESAREYLKNHDDIELSVKERLRENYIKYETNIKKYIDIIKKLHNDDDDISSDFVSDNDKIFVPEAFKLYRNIIESKDSYGKLDSNKRSDVYKNLDSILEKCKHPEVYIIYARIQSWYNEYTNIIKKAACDFPDNARIMWVYGEIEKFRVGKNTAIDSPLFTDPIKSAIDKLKKSLKLKVDIKTVTSLAYCYRYNSENVDGAIEILEKYDHLFNFEKHNIIEKEGYAVPLLELCKAFKLKAEDYEDDFDLWLVWAERAENCLQLAVKANCKDREVLKYKTKLKYYFAFRYFKFGELDLSKGYAKSIIKTNGTKTRIKLDYNYIISAYIILCEISIENKNKSEADVFFETAYSHFLRFIKPNNKYYNKLNLEIDMCKSKINYHKNKKEGYIKTLGKNTKGEVTHGFIYCKTCDTSYFFHAEAFNTKVKGNTIEKLYNNRIILEFVSLKIYNKNLESCVEITITNKSDITNQACNLRDNIVKGNNTGFISKYFEDKGYGIIEDSNKSDTYTFVSSSINTKSNNIIEKIQKLKGSSAFVRFDLITFQDKKTGREKLSPINIEFY